MLNGLNKLGLVLTALLLSQSPAFAEKGQDHPVISRMPGATIDHYAQLDYEEMQLILSKPYKKNGQWIADKTKPVAGKLTYIHYELPNKYSALQTFRNYQKLAKREGMQTLYSCDRPCPNTNLSNLDDLIQNNNDFYINGNKQNQYMVAKKGNLYFFVFVNDMNGTNVFQFIIEEDSLDDGLLSSMASSIVMDGKIDLYGLYFDSGKSTLKSNSKAQLSELAELLSDYPDLKLDIVGHTDSVGSGDQNKKLSNARAAAVLQALVNDYGIESSRLDSLGRGEARPIASNDNAEGRAKNRRVELVALNPEVIGSAPQANDSSNKTSATSSSSEKQEKSESELDVILDNAEKVSKIGSALKSLF
ncbi:OmpA family protein [Alginatibacterium sediminis]|nr:OmpA family protein [Alginatibacterium sediminis]